MVKFSDNFDFPMIQTAIHHETMLGEYADTNDIWLIGEHHSHIHLGDLEKLTNEFQCRCPRDATRTKTAIVVDEGLTGAIIELWMDRLKMKVAFEIAIFRTLNEAECWLGIREASYA
jgi:hypothetical protein